VGDFVIIFFFDELKRRHKFSGFCVFKLKKTFKIKNFKLGVLMVFCEDSPIIFSILKSNNIKLRNKKVKKRDG